MKSLLIATLFLLPGTKSFFGLPLGSSIPKADIRVKDVSGKAVSLQQAKGANGLLVMFSCNTCPYVVRNQGRTKAVCVYAGQHQIGVILLNSNEGSRDGGNSFAEMQSYAKDQDYQWYYALDDNAVLAGAFGASRTPECFLFDKNGILVYHGAIDDSPGDPSSVKRHHLQAAIDEMIDGKPVTVKETRSIGCSIR
ncbi:MAG TPA: thioredoxin family protein [Puia sp.]|nr:thioredoxin family protein [Puia sp.]